ncbi:hypothetical protein GFGA_1c0760 [Gluconobacter frateurii NBRC 103465]|nr:hypothetical protein GFGA_1c0760 [Gluconobacter frateurii NBRC 103465]
MTTFTVPDHGACHTLSGTMESLVMTRQKNWKALFTDAAGLAFAAIWATRGATAAHLPKPVMVASLAVVSLLLLAGFAYRDLIQCRPEGVRDTALLRRVKIMRIVAITVMITAVRSAHHAELLYPLLGCIIGLSYIPMGRAMQEPVHIIVGGVIVGISALSFLLPEPLHLEVAGFGTALAIWVGSVLRLRNSGTFSLPPRNALPS